jgi:hypothetical protein
MAIRQFEASPNVVIGLNNAVAGYLRRLVMLSFHSEMRALADVDVDVQQPGVT